MIERIKKRNLFSVNDLVKQDSIRPFLQIEKSTPLEGVKAFLFNPANIVFVSRLAFEQHGGVHGVIIGMTKQGKRKHVIELIIAVAKSFWGKGVGLALLKTMEQECKKMKIKRLELSTYASNRRAISFYLKSGFIIEGVKKASLMTESGELDDEIMFGKVLN
jgi:RimJ/RimL family protein N-acetyltransferase